MMGGGQGVKTDSSKWMSRTSGMHDCTKTGTHSPPPPTNAPGVEEFLRNEAFCRRFFTAQVHREVLGCMKEGPPLVIIWVFN